MLQICASFASERFLTIVQPVFDNYLEQFNNLKQVALEKIFPRLFLFSGPLIILPNQTAALKNIVKLGVYMEKNSYTEMFQRAKQKSEKSNMQLVASIKQALSNKNVNETVQSRILYSHFSEPKKQ